MSADERIARARRVLEDAGFLAATVEAEGHEGEIAAIRVPVSAWETLVGEADVRVAERVKAAGFRYVSLDLRPLDAPGAA